VTKLDVLTGNTFYMSIFAALDPYRIALTFVGEDLDKILATPPGRELTIIGHLRFGGGARLLIISSVTEAEPTPTVGALGLPAAGADASVAATVRSFGVA
jgi:hypothetical protein